jgi:hypothetical protein
LASKDLERATEAMAREFHKMGSCLIDKFPSN